MEDCLYITTKYKTKTFKDFKLNTVSAIPAKIKTKCMTHFYRTHKKLMIK